ncbi:MAG: DUF4249 domain-containing protein [Bacteroidales bacterium]|nr:DUF4249 domain-containing protein [Bacteroidales bacterium]
MKRVILLVLSSYLLLLFASCEEVIPVDPTTSEAMLVLNGVPSSGRQMSVFFAYSRYFLDNSNNHPVEGAVVTMDVNGHSFRPDSVVRCNYWFPYILQDDDTVAVRVNMDGNLVSAKTYVPRSPQVENLVAVVDTSGTLGEAMGLGAFRLLAVGFDLKDYPDHDDYYCITVDQRDSGTHYRPYFDIYDTVDTTRLTYFVCLDKKLISPEVAAIPGLGDAFFNRLIFSDDLIEGKNHRVSLMLLLLRDTTEVEPFIHEYTLHVESVTPERVKYLKDIATATSQLQIFSEPAPVYSNVDGALGIFAGNARRTYPLAPDTLAATSTTRRTNPTRKPLQP